MMGISLMGQSVLFKMKDGSASLIKVEQVNPGVSLKGPDDEGMNREIRVNDIDTYWIPGKVVKT